MIDSWSNGKLLILGEGQSCWNYNRTDAKGIIQLISLKQYSKELIQNDFQLLHLFTIFMIIISYISTVLSTLRQAAHLSPHPHPTTHKKKRKKKEKKKNNGSPPPPPWHPTQSVDFLMFICCAISYWQPCVNLECTSDQMLQEQITHIWKQQVHFL